MSPHHGNSIDMKLKPKKDQGESTYPTWRDYSSNSGNDLLKILTAVGISVSTAVTPMVAGEKNPKEPVSDSLDKVKLQIDDLIGKLGNKDFRVREKATVALIAMGNTKKKDAKGKKVTDEKIRKAVVEAVTKLKKHKDPEVKQRAKRIILVLTPPKRKSTGNHRPALPGFLVIPEE